MIRLWKASEAFAIREGCLSKSAWAWQALRHTGWGDPETIARWEKMTGRQARHASGKTFTEMSNDKRATAVRLKYQEFVARQNGGGGGEFIIKHEYAPAPRNDK